MHRLSFTFLFCILLPIYAHSRNFSEIERLSGNALQGALELDKLNDQRLSDAEENQIKKSALKMIEVDAISGDPAAAFLLGLIYFEESPRYSSFYDILFDQWSCYHYDPEWGSPNIIDPANQFDESYDIFDISGISDIQTPLKYEDYCLNHAIKNFTFAAENGYSEAMYILGRIYASDYSFNRPLAIRYYNEAVEHGNAQACAALGYEYFNGGNLFNYDFNDAAKWLMKAIESGDYSNTTCLYLGYCYETGRGVTQDIKKAVEIYSMSTNTWEIADILGYSIGNFSIPFRLGILYYSNESVKDYNKAFPYLKWIGEQNIREVGDERGFALRCLSACYRFGRGTDIDTEKADYYLRMAGEFGNIDAKRALKILLAE